jgi:8-oxo-dGTP pyrophosphatase MutT (NUDIX family)
MEDLHQIQMLILRELLFNPTARFSELNIKGLSNDHFSYHINTLINLGYVRKDENGYSLTNSGKEFANRMDTDQVQIEKQPKVAVMVIPYKYVKGRKYILIQERTKEPYYGYRGFMTGKIRFGEKIKETARRELNEETGLDCKDFTIKTIFHDHVVTMEDGKLMEDKMFFIVTAKNPIGKIIDTPNGKNYWVTEDDFLKLDKKYYNEDGIFNSFKQRGHMDIHENTYTIQEF